MQRNCVVIGAGLGGLSCGAVLARWGYNVTLLEQQRQAGGCLQTFVRDGVRFETGMHYIGSAAKGEVLESLLRYLGVRDGLELHELDRDGYDVVRFKGGDFAFRNTPEAFVEGLAAHFPHERDNLATYMDVVYKAAAASQVESFNPMRQPHAQESLWQINSVDSIIDGIIQDPDLRQIVAGNQPLYAGRKGRTPFSLHAFITSFYNRSAWRIAGGSDRIAELLLQGIGVAGGSVLTGCKALEILCDDTRVRGVRYLEGGVERTIQADYVISTIHPALTVDMVRSPLLRPAYRKRIMDLPSTIGVFELYLKFKPRTVPYMNSNRFVYKGSTVWDGDSYTVDDWPRNYLYMHQYPDDGDGFATAGVILAYMRMDELTQWEQTYTGRRGPEYKAFMEQRARRLIESAVAEFPELQGGVDRYWTSSPLTYRDYTGATEGGLYGIEHDVGLGQSGRVSYRTRVGGLLLAGQSVNSHGIMGVLMGSMVVCDSILDNGVLYNDIMRTL